MSHVVVESNCPHCGKKLNRAMETEPCKGPRPGDVAVCIGCIGIAEYGPDLRLVKADLSKIDDETRRTLEAAKTAVRLAHRDRAKPFIEG